MTSVTNRRLSAEDPESMPTLADYLGSDRVQPPGFFLERSSQDLGNAPVGKDRFTAPEWAEREAQRLWRRVWQMACRENDIPNVGDQIAYDIVDQSVIVVRAAPDEIKAYHNACRHRGTRLVEDCASSRHIQCCFHAWTWHLDGSLKKVPCRWDFPELRDKDFGLVECQVARWNGFVFINLDPQAESFEEFLGPEIPEQFRSWPRDRSWKAAHVGKVIPCNWKATLEAFLEVYHAIRVHPDTLPFVADCNAQYDFYGPHCRMIGALGAPSPHLGDGVEPQEVVDIAIGTAVANIFGDRDGDFQIPQLQPGQTPRHLLADFVKQALQAQMGIDYSAASESEVIDGVEYFVFPNLVPWGAYSFPMTYRIRPHGNDPDTCLFEVMVLVDLPDGTPRPPDTPMRLTPPDEPWSEVKEIMGLGPVLDQDMVALRRLQRGLHSDSTASVMYSNYQERNIRNFHAHLNRYLES